MQIVNLFHMPALETRAAALLTVPAGPAVTALHKQMCDELQVAPDANFMYYQAIGYMAYRVLRTDGEALALQEHADDDLCCALHMSQVLEEIREGTGCDHPTLDRCELNLLPAELRERWWSSPEGEEAAEALVFETLETVLEQTRNFPLALELVQYLVTYRLADSLSVIPTDQLPRRESSACSIKLAKYCVPWDSIHSVGRICCLDGEVFLMDGDIDDGTWEDYLMAIGQMENVEPCDQLRRYLKDRTAMPCFDFELEKAVRKWLDSKKA